MPDILLVEDDNNLGLVIADNLRQAGFAVGLAQDGERATHMFNAHAYDLCILDVMLPKKDGFTVAEEIRQTNSSIPILFLTAKSMEEDRLQGFRSGGDDYITKPFSIKELLFRIEVFLKRSTKEYTPDHYTIGAYAFDPVNQELRLNNKTYSLTQKEARVLKYFCDNQQVVIKRKDLLQAVWGTDDYFLGRSMDVFISRLRKYLKKDPDVKITNIHGVGFRFEINR